MAHTRNDGLILRVITKERGRKRHVRKGTMVMLLVAVIAGSVMSGCGGSSELFVLTHPVYPARLNATEIGELRTREIERRQFQYEERGRNSLTHNDRDGITGSGIPLLTWRFGGGSSRPDLAKRYALHKDNLRDSNTSSTDVAQVLSRDER